MTWTVRYQATLASPKPAGFFIACKSSHAQHRRAIPQAPQQSPTTKRAKVRLTSQPANFVRLLSHSL